MRARSFSSSVRRSRRSGAAGASRPLAGVGRRLGRLACVSLCACSLGGSGLGGSGLFAADVPGYYTDPATGQVFRQVTRTIERPEVTAATERRERTVWTPRTVTETRPEARTVYSPVTEYRWVPRLHNRWNPFRAPTVVYHHEPVTHWESRSEVVQQATARTEWVAEKRVEDVPVLQRRIVREQRVEQEPVGTLAPPQASPPGSVDSAVASRLRPLDNSELARVVAGGPAAGRGLPAAASPTLPALTQNSALAQNPARSPEQVGQRATDLSPNAGGRPGMPLAPATTIAMPPQPGTFFR